jgi:hypothetical protein
MATKMTALLLSVLFSTMTAFAADSKPVEPEYKGFADESYSKMEKPSDKPNEVNNSFAATAAKITNDMNHYLRAKRDELTNLQREKSKEFEAAARKEVDEWRKSNPGKSASDFMKDQGIKRQALMKSFQEEKKLAERDLELKKTKFDNYMTEKKKEFRARYNAWLESLKIHPSKEDDAAKKEFKEIPKGKGTVLAPDKDVQKN